MEKISELIKALDIYGIAYSFRYKNKERYQTLTGGIVVILFFILVIVLGIYYFIPFANRKNYTIVYYTMNLASTEEVNLFQSESNFAIGLVCEDNKNEKYSVDDLLDLKAQYILYVKSSNGSFHKVRKNHKIHQCNYDDFYNKYNSEFNFLGLSKYKCLEDKQDTIQGIFTDQVFSYFEFTVAAKNDSVMKEIDRFLSANDCKLQIIYTDIIIDLDNYKEPISQYLNNIFIQLDPTVFIKRAMYFMNQYFTYDDYLMFVFGDENDNHEVKTLYSRYEEYYLYMGFNRNEVKPNYNYPNYARLYLRADLKKTIIKRRYQKFMEFYADASSLLVALYEVLYFIFNFFNYFYAYHSLSQNIFFFKDVKDENHFNIFSKKRQIQEIISLIESQNKNNDSEIFKEDNKNSSNKNSSNKNSKESNVEIRQVQIYNNKNYQANNMNFSNAKINEEDEKTRDKIMNIKGFKVKTRNEYKGNIIGSEEKLNKKKIYEIKQKSNNISNKYDEEIEYTNYSNIEKSSSFSSESNHRKREKILKVENSFNIFEIIITQIFKCCMCKRITIKNRINENANKLLNKKLDIITYVRNMILFDIMQKTLLDNDRNDIINLICRPVISLKNLKKNENNYFYKSYRKQDFEKFSNNIQELMQKSKKDIRENKLISISKEYLKDFI